MIYQVGVEMQCDECGHSDYVWVSFQHDVLIPWERVEERLRDMGWVKSDDRWFHSKRCLERHNAPN